MSEQPIRWITRAAVSERYKISVRTLSRWASEGFGPAPIKVPGTRFIRYREDEVDAWLGDQEHAC